MSGVPGAPVPPAPVPPTAPVPPAAPAQNGVYRTRRPGLAALFFIAVLLFELPAFRLFVSGVFDDPLSSSKTISGIFLIVGLPLFGRGLHALSAGGGRVPDQRAGHGWLHPPVAYLTVGLVLFLAAGLAAS